MELIHTRTQSLREQVKFIRERKKAQYRIITASRSNQVGIGGMNGDRIYRVSVPFYPPLGHVNNRLLVLDVGSCKMASANHVACVHCTYVRAPLYCSVCLSNLLKSYKQSNTASVAVIAVILHVLVLLDIILAVKLKRHVPLVIWVVGVEKGLYRAHVLQLSLSAIANYDSSHDNGLGA
jgi:hypothetical protein